MNILNGPVVLLMNKKILPNIVIVFASISDSDSRT